MAPARFDGWAMLEALQKLDGERRRRADIAQQVSATFRAHGWDALDCGRNEPMFGRVPAYVPRGWNRSACIHVFRRYGVDLSTPYHRSLLELPGVVALGGFEGTRSALERLVCVTVNPTAGGSGDLPAAVEAALSDLDNENR